MSDQDDKLHDVLAAAFTRQVQLEDQFRTRAENQIGVPDYVTIATDAYEAYGHVTDFKNFAGGDMPSWEMLPAQIRLAWVAAVKTAVQEFVAHIFGDPGCFARAYAKGEPTFTLRAQDLTAMPLVGIWIGMNSGAPESKLQDALAKIYAMRDWPTKKAAD